MNCSLPGSSVHRISRQECRSGLPFPTPGDLPNPGIELLSLASPALAGRFFTTTPPVGISEKIPFNWVLPLFPTPAYSSAAGAEGCTGWKFGNTRMRKVVSWVILKDE
ncbi:unnamed protein product [Rangifer tarandus platyrhynchus]|uniref:Uncharacterized protein n=1 Tax=Rangifer tarandus platyrhynchus TaxID=3082113 RepID=A0ABN8XQS0_RANTA|nr:unnamed protein product [Rangifer tarandus platyrhynchus]